MDIHDIAGLSDPIKRLIEVCASGIGKLYEPTYIRRMADARSYELKTLVKTISQNDTNIDIKFSGDTTELKLESQLLHRMMYRQSKIDANTAKIVANAANELNDSASIPAELPATDWIERFFMFAGNISDSDLQEIWGKILSGEISKPQTYSLRLLSILNDLSKNEAQIFKQLTNLIIRTGSDFFVFRSKEKDFHKSLGSLTFKQFLVLADSGLMNPSTTINLNVRSTNNALKSVFIYQTRAILIESNSEVDFNIPIYKLTSTGEQLLNLINNSCEENTAYFDTVANEIKNKNVKVTVGDLGKTEGESIIIRNPKTLN